MTIRYKQIAIEQAADGMVLSDDVLDAKGHVLLPHGKMLTAAILASLKRHDISMLSVISGEASVEEDKAEHKQYEERLAILFRKENPDDNTANALLRQYVSNFRLGNAS